MPEPEGPGRRPTPLDPSGELRGLAGDCVHCGFCLPACPTYQLWGEEMDSPRGRIHLMSQILDGAEGAQAAAEHLDRCLGCMACVTACPSGVRYDRLIEAARGWAEEPAATPAPPGPPSSAEPRRAPSPPPGPARPPRGAAGSARRAVVGMLTGCVQQVFFPQVNAATASVLAAEGCDVVIPAGQGCCGALSWHGGRTAEAASFARRAIETFERAGVDAVVVNSAGCGSAMKEDEELPAGDAGWSGRAAALAGRVRDPDNV